jgi:hypothetical protein
VSVPVEFARTARIIFVLADVVRIASHVPPPDERVDPSEEE